MLRVLGLIGTLFIVHWLFKLDRRCRTDYVQHSVALWLPTIWLFTLFIASPYSIIHTIVFGVSAYTPTAPLASVVDLYIEGDPVARVIGSILIGLGVLVLIRRWSRVETLLRSNVTLLVYVMYCAASTMWADNSFISFRRFIKFFGDIVMGLIVMSEFDAEAAFERVLLRIGFWGIPLTYYGVYCLHSVAPLGLNDTRLVPRGFTPEYNVLATTCGCLIIFFTWLWHRAYEQDDVLASAMHVFRCVVLLAACLWLELWIHPTGRRGSYIIGFMVLLACFTKYVRIRRGMIYGVILGAVMVPYIFFLSPQLLAYIGKDPTLTGRVPLWRSLFELAQNRPWFGYGYDYFWLSNDSIRLHRTLDWFAWEAHNGYLQQLLNLGLVGIALLIWLQLSCCTALVKKAVQHKGIFILCIAYFCQEMVINASEAEFESPAKLWTLFIWTVLLASLPYVAKNKSNLPSRQSLSKEKTHATA